MKESARRRTLSGAAALGAVAAAFGAALALGPLWDSVPFALFLAAVVVATRVGGVAWGLAATVASAALLDFFFVAPFHTLAVARLNALLDLGAFAGVSLLVSAWTRQLDLARRETSAARAEAERRTEDLAAVVEAADDGVVVFAPDGRVTHANGWFRAWWLVHVGSEPCTADELAEALRSADRSSARAVGVLAIDLALRGLHASEVLLLGTREGLRRVRVRATPIRAADGTPRGAVTTWCDVSDLGDDAPWPRLDRPTAIASKN